MPPNYRVVQWSTGHVGKHAIAGIDARPDLDLVGVWVSNPAKVGKDAGELAGLGRELGVAATNDADALLALKPDCIVHTAWADDRLIEALGDLAKFLRAGVNVVSTSPVFLQYPHGDAATMAADVNRGCAPGRCVDLRQRRRPRVRQRRTSAGDDRNLRAHRTGALHRTAELRHLRPGRGAEGPDGIRYVDGRPAVHPQPRRADAGLGQRGLPARRRSRRRA